MASSVHVHHIFYQKEIPVSCLSVGAVFTLKEEKQQAFRITSIAEDGTAHYQNAYDPAATSCQATPDMLVVPVHSIINVQTIELD
jgi:hypothetical protein